VWFYVVSVSKLIMDPRNQTNMSMLHLRSLPEFPNDSSIEERNN
jgi:hypothetical protein